MGAAKSCYKRDGKVFIKGTHRPPQTQRFATSKSGRVKNGKPGGCHNNERDKEYIKGDFVRFCGPPDVANNLLMDEGSTGVVQKKNFDGTYLVEWNGNYGRLPGKVNGHDLLLLQRPKDNMDHAILQSSQDAQALEEKQLAEAIQKSAQDAQVFLPSSCLRPSGSTTTSEFSIALLEEMQLDDSLVDTCGAQGKDCLPVQLRDLVKHREQEPIAQDGVNRRNRLPKMGSTRSRSSGLVATLIESHGNNGSTRLQQAHARPDSSVDDDALLAARLASLENLDQRALEETANQDVALAAALIESQGDNGSSSLRRAHTWSDAAVDDDALLAAKLASFEDLDQQALEETANQDRRWPDELSSL